MSESQAPKSNGKLVINKTDFVMGSVAGAGSGEFHKYRASRRREYERLGQLKEDHEKTIQQKEFQGILDQNRRADEKRTEKKAEKRRKQKERKQNAKRMKMDNTEEEDNDEETIALKSIPVSTIEIPTDGSFLSTMMQQAEKTKGDFNKNN